MRKEILFTLQFLAIFNSVNAVPAYPNKIALTINGESVYITLKGDENCKYAEDEEGYSILPTEKGWVYATEDENGTVKFSDYYLSPLRSMTNQTKAFLQKTKKGLIPPKTIIQTEKTAALSNIYREEKKPAIGFRKALIILMQFKDLKFSKSNEDFQRLFNEERYKEDGALGSVYDYYKWASYGQLDLKSDVIGPFTSYNNMSYYGGNTGLSGNDQNPYALFSEAIDYAIKEVSLSDYDADGDGYVDNIHIIYAGYGEEAGASSNAIWAHEMTFRTITVQGMKIDRYSCAPELRGNQGIGISRIGPHCHEIGHALGAMDYYDTDYETGGQYQGTGKWDIMASGSWNDNGIAPAGFNPYVKIYDFGWTEAKFLENKETNTIDVSSKKGNIFRLNTGTNNDFFLIENRDHQYFLSAEPGNGLLIFHIGPNLKSRSSTNTINSTFPQQCYVVCASSSFQKPIASSSSYGNINSAGCTYPGVNGNSEFSDSSTPAALTINGNKTGINISNISFDNDLISLYYSNVNHENPVDPPSTQDEGYLWGEDFEQLRLPSSWNFSDIIGNSKAEVITKLSPNSTPTSPIADNGNGYLKLSALPQQIVGEYRTLGLLESPLIKLSENGKYILAFSIRKFNTNPNSCDSISVILNSDSNVKGYQLVKLDVKAQNTWERYSSILPKNYNEFSMGLFFNMDYGTTMFFDNVCIYDIPEGTEVKNISQERENKDHPLNVYTFSGSKIEQPSRGLYIIRKPNGTFKKIFIK